MKLAWHHLIFDVPDTWEVARYKKSYRDGMLGLVDRWGDVMQVFWRLTRSRSDVPRRLAELVAELGESLDVHDVRRMIGSRHGWTVFMPDDDRVPVLAARTHTHGPATGDPADARVMTRSYGEHVLLYCVFPPRQESQKGREGGEGAQGGDRAAIDRVLKSYETNYGAERQWAAFGLEIALPAEIDLTKCHLLPTSQILEFENRRGEKITLQRYGMMSAVLREEPIDVFYARMKGQKTQLMRDGRFEHGGVEGVKLSYKTRGRGGLTAMTSPLWQGRVWAWTCPDIERLYVVDQNAREDHLIPDLMERVVCRGAAPAPTEPIDTSVPRSGADIIDRQLRSVPAVSPHVTASPDNGGRLMLSAPRAASWWRSPVRGLFSISEQQTISLEPIGAEVFALIDGKRPMEGIINAHARRWHLSFQESRMMILEYVHRLMRKRLVYVIAPDKDDET